MPSGSGQKPSVIVDIERPENLYFYENAFVACYNRELIYFGNRIAGLSFYPQHIPLNAGETIIAYFAADTYLLIATSANRIFYYVNKTEYIINLPTQLNKIVAIKAVITGQKLIFCLLLNNHEVYWVSIEFQPGVKQLTLSLELVKLPIVEKYGSIKQFIVNDHTTITFLTNSGKVIVVTTLSNVPPGYNLQIIPNPVAIKQISGKQKLYALTADDWQILQWNTSLERFEEYYNIGQTGLGPIRKHYLFESRWGTLLILLTEDSKCYVQYTSAIDHCAASTSIFTCRNLTLLADNVADIALGENHANLPDILFVGLDRTKHFLTSKVAQNIIYRGRVPYQLENKLTQLRGTTLINQLEYVQPQRTSPINFQGPFLPPIFVDH